MNEKMMESFMNSIQYTSTNTQTEQWLSLFSTVFTQTNLIQSYIFFLFHSTQQRNKKIDKIDKDGNCKNKTKK